RSSGLPPWVIVISTGALLFSGSLTRPPPPCRSKRSENVGSRTSRESVARNRNPSVIWEVDARLVRRDAAARRVVGPTPGEGDVEGSGPGRPERHVEL